MCFEACYLEVIDQKRSLKTTRLATWCRFRCNLWIHEMIFDQTEQLVHFWAATIIINHIYCLFFFIEIYRIAFRWNTNFFFHLLHKTSMKLIRFYKMRLAHSKCFWNWIAAFGKNFYWYCKKKLTFTTLLH